MDPICLMYGFAISLVVSFLKRWPWAARNPKWLATIISTAFSVGSMFVHGGGAVTFAQVQALATCIAVQLSASVATHEIAVQPIVDAMRGALIGTKS